MVAQVLSSAVLGWVTSADLQLMRRVNSWRPPRWMRVWMLIATRGGDGWLWYLLGSIIAVAGGPDRWAALAAAGMAAAAGIGLFMKLKRICNRKRPCAIEPHCWVDLLPPDQFSFPSGHTITAFAVAISLGDFYPTLAMGLCFCAVSVALSRIILGMHFLSDVIAGAAIGTALGYGAAVFLRMAV